MSVKATQYSISTMINTYELLSNISETVIYVALCFIYRWPHTLQIIPFTHVHYGYNMKHNIYMVIVLWTSLYSIYAANHIRRGQKRGIVLCWLAIMEQSKTLLAWNIKPIHTTSLCLLSWMSPYQRCILGSFRLVDHCVVSGSILPWQPQAINPWRNWSTMLCGNM